MVFCFLFLHKESAHQWIIFQSRRERAINRGHFGREKEEKKKTQQSAGREEMKSSCRTNARHFVQGRRKKPVRDGFRVDSGGSRILARTFKKKKCRRAHTCLILRPRHPGNNRGEEKAGLVIRVSAADVYTIREETRRPSGDR